MSLSSYWGQLRALVALLLLIQLVSVAFAWWLNPLGGRSQTAFPLLLALNLVAFSAVSYTTRVSNKGETVSRLAILAGSALMLLFMILIILV